MSAPLVSVVIPTHNRAYCVPQAIDSVLDQTYPHVEAVVVDDGSTDATSFVIESRYGHDPRVRYFHQQQQGTNFARNKGLREARGDLVALLDSDDSFLPFKLELQVACLDAVPAAGMIWTDMDAVDPHGLLTPRYLQRMYSNYQRYPIERLFSPGRPIAPLLPHRAFYANALLYSGDIFSPMVMGNLVHTSTCVLRRERLERVGGFNETLQRSGVDFDFHLRTCKEGPVAFADVSTILYRIGLADQMTHPSRRVNMAENFLRTILPILANDRDRITLTEEMIQEVLAEAHAFIGRALLEQHDPARARAEFIKSLQHTPLQPEVMKLLVLTLIPDGAQEPVRKAYRALRRPSRTNLPKV